MKQYLDLVTKIITEGTVKTDRTGVGTKAIFGHQMRFDLNEGFPLVTTKFTAHRLVMVELFWLLRGDTNIKYLHDHNCRIWDEWADENGDLGPVYGQQWRRWGGYIDQIANVINDLKTNPDSRRIIVSAWNASDLKAMALVPCHAFFQFYVVDGKLSCQLYQRSCDVALGVPFNIASYAALTHILAKICGLQVGEFIWTGGDVHIYSNHIEGMKELLNRQPKALPTIKLPETLASLEDIDSGRVQPEDIQIVGYEYHPKISFDVAV